MKIVIDGAYLSRKPKGVTNICISIINAYVTAFPRYTFFVVMPAQLDEEVKRQLIYADNLKFVTAPLFMFITHPVVWSIFKMNSLIRKIDPDLVIASNFLITPYGFPKQAKLALFIHDLVYQHHRETMKVTTRTYMDAFIEKSIKRADLLWFNSNYTLNEFLKVAPEAKKMLFVGAGINKKFLQLAHGQGDVKASKLVIKNKLEKKYLLFVGTTEPRKNILFLLKLFKEISSETDLHLILVGPPGWGTTNKEIETILNESTFPSDRIHQTGYITVNELVYYYKNAFCYISTSFNEGLGLPQLEAMACGCPVVSPNNSAMFEVVDGAGILVDGWDLKTWSQAITSVRDNRELLQKKGYERVKKYNWEDIICQLDARLANLER